MSDSLISKAIEFKNVYPIEFRKNANDLAMMANSLPEMRKSFGINVDFSEKITSEEILVLSAIMTTREVTKKMSWSSIEIRSLQAMWQSLGIPKLNTKIFDTIDVYIGNQSTGSYLNFAAFIRTLTGRSFVEYVSGRRNEIRWGEFVRSPIARVFKDLLTARQLKTLMSDNDIYTIEDLILNANVIFAGNFTGLSRFSMTALKNALRYYGIVVSRLGMNADDFKSQYDRFVDIEGANREIHH